MVASFQSAQPQVRPSSIWRFLRPQRAQWLPPSSPLSRRWGQIPSGGSWGRNGHNGRLLPVRSATGEARFHLEVHEAATGTMVVSFPSAQPQVRPDAIWRSLRLPQAQWSPPSSPLSHRWGQVLSKGCRVRNWHLHRRISRAAVSLTSFSTPYSEIFYHPKCYFSHHKVSFYRPVVILRCSSFDLGFISLRRVLFKGRQTVR